MIVADVSVLEQSAIAHFTYGYVKIMGLNDPSLKLHPNGVAYSFGVVDDGKRDAASVTVGPMSMVHTLILGCVLVYQRLSHDDLGYLHTPTRCLMLKFLVHIL